MENDDVVAQLTAKSPRRILEDLAKLAKPTTRVRPEVELYLASGQLVRGRFAGIGDDAGPGGPIALVHTGGSPRAPSVAYVRVDQVVAVTIADASVLVKPAATDAEPAPSKLELARALGARADSLTTALGRALPMTATPELDDEGRRAVASVLSPLVDTLRAISRDDSGKKALDALSGIELGTGARSEVRRDGAKLVIIVPRASVDAYTAERLRNEIEKLL